MYFYFYIKYYLRNGEITTKYPFLSGFEANTKPLRDISARDDFLVSIGNNSDIQEKLFGEFIHHVFELQDHISTTNRVILYKVNKESGLGNVIVGLVSSLVAAVASNRGMQSMSLVTFAFY